jgi:hypothetical protein
MLAHAYLSVLRSVSVTEQRAAKKGMSDQISVPS